MTDRRILPTITAVFVLVGAGQLIGAAPGLAEQVRGQLLFPTNLTPINQVTADGIMIVEDDTAATPSDDTATALRKMEQTLTAQRLEMREATQRLEAQQQQVAAAEARLSERERKEHFQLASLYAQMPTANAVTLLAKLEPEEAARFIGVMQQDAAARLLAELPAEVAIAVTRELMAVRASEEG